MAHIIHTMGTCCCTTKFQWHHEHFRLFEFEVWVLASYCNRSLSCFCFCHELRQGSRSFPNPRWQLYHWHEAPDCQHQTQRKQSDVLLATISSEEIEAAKKPIVAKNKTHRNKSTVWAVHVFMSWAEERNESSKQECHIKVLCTSNTNELCNWLCVFVKEARRDDRQLYTIHHVVSHNCFLCEPTFPQYVSLIHLPHCYLWCWHQLHGQQGVSLLPHHHTQLPYVGRSSHSD